MEEKSYNTEVLPETSEENGTAEPTETIPEPAKEILVPVKFNKEIRNLELDEAAKLAQKGLKFDAIAEDYDNLRRLAASDGKSVSEFLQALDKSSKEARKKELLEECGGNEEMADYVLSLESNPDGDLGLNELKAEFPEIKDISDLPESVVENAKLKGTLLLDEYLRYRHTAKRNARRAAAQSEGAQSASIGSQTDRRGGVSPETAEFLKGLWR
ncbi:MAG: hypothetical protein ACI4F7_08720 [Acutalibacteraceae bacterium]